tara:strand:- start:219 stop:1574 length:1356 start_codon:yes stop_codon:yes gene_type:complete
VAALKGTTKGNLGKYTEALVEQLEDSMTRGSYINAMKKAYKIKNTKQNRSTIQEFVSLANKTGGTGDEDAIALTLETTTPKKPVKMGDINKPFSKPKRGDLGEGVIAAAICARFVNKNQNINPARVYAVLKVLKSKGIKRYPGKDGRYTEATFNSKNLNPKILDKVKCYISLSLSAITGLLDPKSEYREWLPPYVESACKYANSPHVAKWAKILYENNRVDHIEVISDGLSGQKDTKVDTLVKVTDDEGKLVPVNINLSMKVDNIGQFGQVSGLGFNVQEELWERMFGYKSKLQHLKDRYNKLVEVDHRPVGAANMIYENVNNMVNNELKTNPDRVLKHIAEGITHFATLHEPHVTVLNLGKGGTKLYDYSEFYKALSTLENLETTLKLQSGKHGYGYWQMMLSGNQPGGTKKPFLQIRIRVEVKSDGSRYVRNLIEKMPLLGEILAETIT